MIVLISQSKKKAINLLIILRSNLDHSKSIKPDLKKSKIYLKYMKNVYVSSLVIFLKTFEVQYSYHKGFSVQNCLPTHRRKSKEVNVKDHSLSFNYHENRHVKSQVKT